MPPTYTENRNERKGKLPDCVIYPRSPFVHPNAMLTTQELLRRLGERGVKNAAVARALNVTPSRVTEMYKGLRALKLDEAVKLVETFDLEPEPSRRAAPLPSPIARLIVLYVAAELGVDAEQEPAKVQELSEDVRAFSEFVADPQVRESIEAATAFLQAMRLRRPLTEPAG
jgi:hypothetical protein